jgi:serine/threonine protein kinase
VKSEDFPLPYDLVEATAAIDIWSFGAVLYQLHTGEPLFPVDRDDDLTVGANMKELHEWNDIKKMSKLGNVSDPSAHSLLNEVLSADPSKRYKTMEDLLQDGYFTTPSKAVMPSSMEEVEFEYHGAGRGVVPPNVTRVIVDDTVTTIGERAFANCSSLTAIEIYVSVTFIVRNAFNGCSSLASIRIPTLVKRIGPYAFADCLSLTWIKIPSTVTSIGEGAFHGCSSLESITIPHSVKTIGANAFNGCDVLTEVELVRFVTTIGEGPFYDHMKAFKRDQNPYG